MAKRKPKRTYGDGSIYWNESRNQWVGQYIAGTGTDGKQKKKFIYSKDFAGVSKVLIIAKNLLIYLGLYNSFIP